MADFVRVTSVGDKELRAKIAALGAGATKAVRAVLYRKAEEISGKAKQAVPVDTGALRSTIHVEGPKGSEGHISVSVVAGGPAAPYAEPVHEDLGKFHPNGTAKYIERPFLEVLPSVKPALLEALDSVAKDRSFNLDAPEGDTSLAAPSGDFGLDAPSDTFSLG